jgi:hypothetical protein
LLLLFFFFFFFFFFLQPFFLGEGGFQSWTQVWDPLSLSSNAKSSQRHNVSPDLAPPSPPSSPNLLTQSSAKLQLIY